MDDHWYTSAKTSVLFLKFSDSALEKGVLSFSAVTGVLCRNAIAVRTGLFTLFRCYG